MDLLVFRADAGQETRPGSLLVRELSESIRQNHLLQALLRAGELECALLDNGGESTPIAAVTDALAAALVNPEQADLTDAIEILRSISVPRALVVNAPEGFCFYGLHPLDYVDLLRTQFQPAMPAFVIGIRSIGSTLSAVAAAYLRAPRITVRPRGHPFHRTTEFSGEQAATLREYQQRGATFFVVDEGPGLSGSSFLSVGEALVGLGVPEHKIVFVGSRDPDITSLVTTDAAKRWQRFRLLSVTNSLKVPANKTDLADWREFVLANTLRQLWPGGWQSMSAPKCFSADGSLYYKFEGLGHYGRRVRERANIIAAAGFGPHAQEAENGFSAYPWLKGKYCTPADMSPEILNRIADYLAFRIKHFAVLRANAAAQQEMAQFNLQQLTDQTYETILRVVHPVIADARMMPYKWIRTAEGRLMKLDSALHGDNHFFPGPVDIAWDVAGTIVEWDLGTEQTESLLAAHLHRTGDDASKRYPDYVLAYCAFEAGYARLAADATKGTDEHPRLMRDVERYLEKLQQIRNRIQRLRSPRSLVLPA